MPQIKLRIKGQIHPRWSDWFDGLVINYADAGDTVLTGFVQDEAALYGIITRLRDLGLKLISLDTEEFKENQNEHTN